MDIFSLWLALPPDLFDYIIFDFQTLVVAHIVITSTAYRYKQIYQKILQRRKNIFKFNLRVIIPYHYIRCAKDWTDLFLAPFTLQKKIRLYIEANSAYALHLCAREDFVNTPVVSYIINSNIRYFMRNVLIEEEWSSFSNTAAYRIVDAFLVINESVRRQKIINNLYGRNNYVLIALLTYVHKVDLDDRDIRNISRLLKSNKHEFGIRYNNVLPTLIQCLIYYLLDDPKYDQNMPNSEFTYRSMLASWDDIFYMRGRYSFPPVLNSFIKGLDQSTHEHLFVEYCRQSAIQKYGILPRKWMKDHVYINVSNIIILTIYAPGLLYKHKSHIDHNIYDRDIDYSLILDILDTKKYLSVFITFYAHVFGRTLSREFILGHLGHDEPVRLLKKIR